MSCYELTAIYHTMRDVGHAQQTVCKRRIKALFEPRLNFFKMNLTLKFQHFSFWKCVHHLSFINRNILITDNFLYFSWSEFVLLDNNQELIRVSVTSSIGYMFLSASQMLSIARKLLRCHEHDRSYPSCDMLTTRNFVTNQTPFNLFQISHWQKVVRHVNKKNCLQA